MTKLNSRIAQFYNKSVDERLKIISEMTGGTGFSRDTTPMNATIFFKVSFPTTKEFLKYPKQVPHLVSSIRQEFRFCI